MRSRGSLGSEDDEDFGRIPFCGGICYIPLGCVFRRYIRHLQTNMEENNRENVSRTISLSERRMAIEQLLLLVADHNGKSTSRFRLPLQRKNTKPVQKVEPASSTTHHSTKDDVEIDVDSPVDDDYSSCSGPICSICLAELEESITSNAEVTIPPLPPPPLRVKTCSHVFHRECILGWLQRKGNTDCPCCRVPMVSEDDIWRLVKHTRREQKRKSQLQHNKTTRDFAGSNEDVASETEDYHEEDMDVVDEAV